MDPIVASAFISATATIVGVGATAAVAIVGYRTSHAALNATRVADHYSRAIEQLGSAMQDVRIGGIYALERVGRDSARDYQTVVDVLAAFIREHSHEQWPLPKADHAPTPERMTRPDVQAALTVIGRRDLAHDRPGPGPAPIDLSDANLTRAYLNGVNLNRAALPRANLTGANLTGAKLQKAKLTNADLTNARLPGADLTDADLIGAKLSGADLTGADLTGTKLTGVELTGAKLTKRGIDQAHLAGADIAPVNWVPDI
jgi:Pentapeptide repeats (8 copies)